VSNLAVNIKTAPASGKEWKFTVKKTTAAGVTTATGVTCTILQLTTSCSSSATAAFLAGESLALEVLGAGNPASWGIARWAVTLGP
jgi:hypothetical protein